MNDETMWRDLMIFLQSRSDSIVLPSEASAETFSSGASRELILKTEDNSLGLQRSTLRYDKERNCLAWNVFLLKKKKDRKKFFRLLRNSGKQALEFIALGELLTCGALHLDNKKEGPVLRCVQDLSRGVSDELVGTMLREMRCALLMRDKIQSALAGGSMRISIGECIHFSTRHPYGEDEGDEEWVDVPTKWMDAPISNVDASVERKSNSAEIPQRVLDINVAIMRGDLHKARLLACGNDLFEIPEEI
jgi:hypothetical protein